MIKRVGKDQRVKERGEGRRAGGGARAGHTLRYIPDMIEGLVPLEPFGVAGDSDIAKRESSRAKVGEVAEGGGASKAAAGTSAPTQRGHSQPRTDGRTDGRTEGT